MFDEIDLNYAQEEDEENIEKIYKQYNAIVYKNNHAFFLKGRDFDDLTQEKFIGLFNTIKSYDKFKNTTYIYLYVRRQIISTIKCSYTDKFKSLSETIRLYKVTRKNMLYKTINYIWKTR